MRRTLALTTFLSLLALSHPMHSGAFALLDGRTMTVTVHSIGAADAPTSAVVVRDGNGRVQARAKVPALRAPRDLLPKTARVVLSLPAVADLARGSVSIEMAPGVKEITLRNNRVRF